MAAELFVIKNKIPEISYAFTSNGIELAVLDITNPNFISCTDEQTLRKMLPYVQKNAEKNAGKFNKIPDFIKKFLAKRSFTMAELLQKDGESEFASGITTLMMKLGPKLIGKGKKRFWDRQVSKGFGALVIRIRVRDLSNCLADAMIPMLRKHPGKDLCLINIAGGTASDSINALILAQKEDPACLKNRKIEINVLDIDISGPEFAHSSLMALKEQGGRFCDLDISFRHIKYDWNNTEKLEELLTARKNWMQVCSSEGGLFEYGSDEVIIRNLNALQSQANDEVVVAGTLLRDKESIDAGMLAALQISTNFKPRLLGKEGFKRITETNNWKIRSITEGNPRYLIFSIEKNIFN
jgi:hypothetical protein